MISVIIAVYNAERYLGEAIESALDQTLPPKEVIVIDDGSTDGTAEVARSFGDRIVYERCSRAGFAAGRNRGVELSTSAYLAFLDADDRFVRDKLERQLGVLQAEPEVDAVLF